MKIQTPYTHTLGYCPSGGISLTVPDQTMSVSELIRRFTNGLPLTGQKVALYDDELDKDDSFDDLKPDLRKLDLSEIADLKEHAANEVIRMQSDLQKASLQRKQKSQASVHQNDDDKRGQNNPLKNLDGGARGGAQTGPSKNSNIKLLELELELEKLKQNH